MFRNKNNILLSTLLIFCAVFLLSAGEARAKVYIDIISSPRKIPIAIMELGGNHGKEVTDILEYDLEFSGLFLPMDREAFLEEPGQPFSRDNWTGIGAEAVVKGYVTEQFGKLTATVSLYDAFEGRALMEKNYTADYRLTSLLAHNIANDIYKKITGRESVFMSKLAFVLKKSGGQKLQLMDWDGKRAEPLTQNGSIILSPRWSADGTKVIYSIEKNRSWGIYLLDLSSRKEVPIITSRGTNITGDFFPDPDMFTLSSSKAGTPDIYVFNIKKSRLMRLTKGRGIEVSPAVSPDGKTIAFVSDRGGNPQIYTMDKIGYNRTRLTFNGKYNTSPTWSPNGDLLAFSGNDEGRNQIYIIRPGGSGLKKLTDTGNNEEPSFSPDGRFIAFTSDRDGRKGIYIMRANGESQRRITPPDIEATCPRWSPK
jgi:TolB protein